MIKNAGEEAGHTSCFLDKMMIRMLGLAGESRDRRMFSGRVGGLLLGIGMYYRD